MVLVLSCMKGDKKGSEWGLLNWGMYTRRWDVPWGGKETVGGMALWAATFLGTAFLLVPALFIKMGTKVSLRVGMASGPATCYPVSPCACAALLRTCRQRVQLLSASVAGGTLQIGMHDLHSILKISQHGHCRTCQIMGRWTGLIMQSVTR